MGSSGMILYLVLCHLYWIYSASFAYLHYVDTRDDRPDRFFEVIGCQYTLEYDTNQIIEVDEGDDLCVKDEFCLLLTPKPKLINENRFCSEYFKYANPKDKPATPNPLENKDSFKNEDSAHTEPFKSNKKISTLIHLLDDESGDRSMCSCKTIDQIKIIKSGRHIYSAKFYLKVPKYDTWYNIRNVAPKMSILHVSALLSCITSKVLLVWWPSYVIIRYVYEFPETLFWQILLSCVILGRVLEVTFNHALQYINQNFQRLHRKNRDFSNNAFPTHILEIVESYESIDWVGKSNIFSFIDIPAKGIAFVLHNVYEMLPEF